ncbi:MAG: site-specific integrase [Cyanobacteriota bacterium]|nr:site-specific integrase [Cyanobacteriota bacterium]
MPATRRTEPWEVMLRDQVSGLAAGWTVREHRGKVKLVVRRSGQPMEALTLPFPWAKTSMGDAYTRLRNIYVHWSEGHGLRAAAELAEGKAPSTMLDWARAASRFQEQKRNHGNHIKEGTWFHAYEPVISMAVELMGCSKPPSNPADLLDACIRDWTPGSRMRQIRAQSLAQFLSHCVQREHFPDIWLPPADLKRHVGRRDASVSVTMKGDPFTSDHQILDLLDSLPKSPNARRWHDALQLLAELGLRPIELLHLSVRTDPHSSEPYWWCGYKKRSGGGDTEARRVFPLSLEDRTGRLREWALLERWQAGEIQLPPLRGGNGAGDSFGTYLGRQKAWLELRDQLAMEQRRLVPYSFRHTYSLRGHRRGIDAGAMAHSMGHSLEVHLRSYPWASASNTAAAFARASLRRRARGTRGVEALEA